MTDAPLKGWFVPAGAAALILFHAALGLTVLDWGRSAVLFCLNLFALIRGAIIWQDSGRRPLAAYVAGYAGLFALVGWVSGAPLLFVVFGFLYVGLAHVPYFLGYLAALVLSIMVITPYWVPTFLLLSMLYGVLMATYRHKRDAFLLACFVIGGIILVMVALPMLYMVTQTSLQTLAVTLTQSQFGRALLISLISATVTTLIVLILGVPLAYAMARSTFPGKQVLDSLIDVPILIPQSVVGIALLVFVGPKTPIGQFLSQRFDISVSGTLLGIVACQLFVSSPFLIRSAMNAFDQMGARLEYVSRTLGAPPASTFFRISLPLASRAIFAGAILTWARAISETGSLMIVAYHPFTISVLAFDTFTQYGLDETRPVAVLLVIVCLWAFVVLRWMRENPPRFLGRRSRSARA